MHLMTMLQTAAQTAAAGATDAAAQVASGATDNPSATVALAVVVPFLLQALKNASWFPVLTRETGKINFAVGVLAAAAATFGIHATWDATAGGTITLPGLHGIWQGLVQLAGQQVTYKGLVVPAETLGEIRAMLARALTPPPISEGAAKAERRE